MSQSTTSGGGRVCRRARAMSRISPPCRRLSRIVRRRSTRGPSGSGRSRRVGRRSSGRTSLRISRFGGGDIGGAHRLEIHPLQAFVLAHREHRIHRRRLLARALAAPRAAWRTPRRCGGSPAAARSAGGFSLPASINAMTAACRAAVGIAPEQRERLVEHLLVLVPVDHGGRQRGAELRLVADVDQRQRAVRGDRFRRSHRQPRPAQQAGEVHDVGGEMPDASAMRRGHAASAAWASATRRAASAPRTFAISS